MAESFQNVYLYCHHDTHLNYLTNFICQLYLNKAEIKTRSYLAHWFLIILNILCLFDNLIKPPGPSF